MAIVSVSPIITPAIDMYHVRLSEASLSSADKGRARWGVGPLSAAASDTRAATTPQGFLEYSLTGSVEVFVVRL